MTRDIRRRSMPHRPRKLHFSFLNPAAATAAVEAVAAAAN